MWHARTYVLIARNIVGDFRAEPEPREKGWDRDNALSVTTSQCGPYLRGISTSISQGYHRVKSAGVPRLERPYCRGTRSKIANEGMFMCRDKKNPRPPAPPDSRNLLCFRFRGRRKSGPFLGCTLNAARC